MAHFIFPYLFIFIILGTVLGQILPDITTCGSLVGDISAALNEIVNMATIAGEAVSQMAGAPPSNPTQMLSVADRQVLFNTANAFFGVGDADGFARMVQVQAILRQMASLRTNQPRITIYCGDTTLYRKSDVDADGDPILIPPGFQYVFNNPINPSAPAQFMPLGFRTCQLTVNGKTPIGYAEIDKIILCPNTLGMRVTSPNPNTPVVGQALLDAQTTISTVLFHELLHVTVPGMTGDSGGGIAIGGERYGFADCTSLRGTLASVLNPDSITLFALALWLGGNDWSSGTAQPYPINPLTP